MLSYNEAEKKMAELIYREIIFHNEQIKPLLKDGTENTGLEFKQIPDKILAQREILHRDTESFGKELAARPEFFDVMQPWMVDVKGEGDGIDVLALEDLDFKRMIEQQGPLASQIQNFITNNGYHITDRGGGAKNWHVGVPCNEAEARRLCSMLHIQFKKAIDSGIIRVVKHFWGWKLPTLYNWDAVGKYFEEK